jgi:hypothetical protein
LGVVSCRDCPNLLALRLTKDVIRSLLLTASKSAYGAHCKESACSFVYRRSGNNAWQQLCDGLPTPQHSALATIESLSTVENDLNTLIAEEGEKTKILARGPKNAESSGQKQP